MCIDIIRFTCTDIAAFVDTDICPLAELARISEIIQDDGTLLGGGAYFDS